MTHKGERMKILVAIANYGFKNAESLKKIIYEYKSMPCDKRIVILSNVVKELGSDIEVIVGLPAKDPWSLPFGHQKIFADRINNYDLFIYSEDDMLLTWKNIESFLELSKALSEDDIVGFVRYELDSTGRRWYPDFNGSSHWLPNSINKVDKYTIAEFSNAHSACYVLTRDQLKRAINSGGYLVGPHQGRYDLLCSAATDPYTQCGFTKVICISQIEEFLIHHLPNAYIGKLGLGNNDFQKQIELLLSLGTTGATQDQLFPTEKKISLVNFDKDYYDPCNNQILSLIPEGSKSVLSVGCGSGETESELVKRGIKVEAIPIDSVIGKCAEAKGITVLPPGFEKAREMLKRRKFDCIIFLHVLQHLSNPIDVLSDCQKYLNKNGIVVITVPNLGTNFLRRIIYRYFKKDIYKYFTPKNRESFGKTLLHYTATNMTVNWLKKSGFKIVRKKYYSERKRHIIKQIVFKTLNKYIGSNILLVARRQSH
jgi:2-polyprenyl-3-methyl-5-hydroxy-6-metoxy-1,4-benzoquinol methylase